MYEAIDAGLVRACHDLSEGGLAVAAAEMAFAGGFGARILLGQVPHVVEPPDGPANAVLLFSESNTRDGFIQKLPSQFARIPGGCREYGGMHFNTGRYPKDRNLITYHAVNIPGSAVSTREE